jgi:acyl-CoA reductase-like NAD-dependent aldehyde dehydrogenase
MADYTMMIDGKPVAGPDTFGVVNPATGAVFARVPECTRAQLDDAMAAAARAFPTWSRDEARRRQVLRDCATALSGQAERLAPLLTQEQGKPLSRSGFEIHQAGEYFGLTAKLEVPLDVVQDDAKRRVEVRRKPFGVVVAITPWNFPLLLAVWKIAPALLAGNTVVIKPSPFTPITTLVLGEILRQVVPPGVLNVVSGGNELGSWMTSHPTPRKISFTGSVATGKKIAAAAAPDLKRVTLELGGNDPAILLPDVDVGAVAPKIFWSAFENCGQICAAIKRVYVHEDSYRPLVEALAEMARAARVGDGMDAETQIGPLNNAPQLERVTELVEDAKRRGGRIAAGGERIGATGYFFQPTIVADVSDGVRLVDEEQFGPALPIVAYHDVDDAVRRANATHFGLDGSVWSSDVARATEVAGQLECGSAWVNQHMAIMPGVPFGGSKWSGIGVEHGHWGLTGFTEIQVVNISKR